MKRDIVKVRVVAGSVVVSLPQFIREPLGLNPGDRVMITCDVENGRLIVTKEDLISVHASNRQSGEIG